MHGMELGFIILAVVAFIGATAALALSIKHAKETRVKAALGGQYAIILLLIIVGIIAVMTKSSPTVPSVGFPGYVQ